MIDTLLARAGGCSAVLLGCVLLLGACQRAQADEDKAQPHGVTLPEEQIGKLGILTEPAKAVAYTAEIPGYGIVMPHDAIAAGVAELMTAQLTEKQSHAALERAQSLQGTPGALSGEAQDLAGRQYAADAAAQTLAAQRLSSVLGLAPPWRASDRPGLLRQLAEGKVKLLRATFPLGTLQGATPKSLRAAHLDAVRTSAPDLKLGVTLTAVWDAPADAAVPGRSFFALLKSGGFVEGERLLVWAPGPASARSGVLIPSSAIVVSDGKYWCYVQEQRGTYRRIEVNADRPVDGGFVVTEGVRAGDSVVKAAAGLLLARESNADTDAD